MKKPSTMTLKRKLDKLFKAMVRARDADKPCASCGRSRDLQAGHFVVCKYLPTRWHPWNVHGECEGCNAFDKMHLIGYSEFMTMRYGVGIIDYLMRLRAVQWKVLPDQLVRLIDATDDPKEYERIWFDVQKEFAPGFEFVSAAVQE